MLMMSALAAIGAAPVDPGPPPAPGGEREATPPIHAREGATATYKNGYSPSQIRHAYGFDQLTATGSGQKIAIVDAYGSPSIQKDLAVFSQQFALPAANLTIAYPTGKPKKTDAGWALETSLDVEWAHAIAPEASILLAVAKTNSFTDLMAAVDYAVSHGATAISMSWGAREFSGEGTYDSHFQGKNGVVFTASSGDNGAGVSYPAASPGVVSVGGTTLKLDGSNNWTSETAWSGSGGGVSAFEGSASYQSGFTSGNRGVPDVSLVADPATGVAVYHSTRYFGSVGWFVVGGTSAGSPMWAALVAVANQGRTSPLTGGHSALYALAGSVTYGADYRDIQSGTNGSCGANCTAVSGYDLVTGLGSPLANNLIPGLVSQ